MADENQLTENKETRTEGWRDIICIIFIAYLLPLAFIPAWLISRWSRLTRWIVTVLSLIAWVILATTAYKGYKYVQYQRSYVPVLGVQQAVDLYGVANGKYPTKLDDLKPTFLVNIPSDKNLDYKPAADLKSYTLQATVEGKVVELRPVFAQLPQK